MLTEAAATALQWTFAVAVALCSAWCAGGLARHATGDDVLQALATFCTGAFVFSVVMLL